MKAFSDFLGIPLESASVDEKAFDRAERSVVEKPVVIDNAPTPVPASSEIAVPNETAKPLVEVVGGRPVTTSVRLAEVFEKNHRNVIMPDCSDAMRPAVFISMKGLEHFCSHGSPKRRERGKAFMEWLKVAAIPATKGGD